MTCSSPVIVNINNNDVKSFTDVFEITIGRNKNCSFDIPDQTISRMQCSITLTEDKWIIKDLSRHKSTLVNGKRILDKLVVLKSGDIFSFQAYQLGVFAFFYRNDDVAMKYKKRKCSNEDVEHVSKMPCYELQNPNSSFQNNKQDESSTDLGDTQVSDKSNNDITTVLKELEKYKSLYFDAVKDLALETKSLNEERAAKKVVDEQLMDEINNNKMMSVQMEAINKHLKKLHSKCIEHTSYINILKTEKELLAANVQKQEDINERMIVQMQELTECLKESELEQTRLHDEFLQSKLECPKKSAGDHQLTVENLFNDKGEKTINGVTLKDIEEIVSMVEAHCTAAEIKQLQKEVSTRDDKITDMAHRFERLKLELMETIDGELLCTICSEVIYFAITLNCKHTFCKACITEWKNKKKECPMCRTKIKSEVHPLAIDSFIDRLIEFIGGDLKSRRDVLKEERSKAVVAASTSRGSSSRRRHQEPINLTHRRTRRNTMLTMTGAVNMMQQSNQPHAINLPFPAFSPYVNVIDLTVLGSSNYTPR